MLVTVIDYDRVGGNEPIGQVLLGADQKGLRKTEKALRGSNQNLRPSCWKKRCRVGRANFPFVIGLN